MEEGLILLGSGALIMNQIDKHSYPYKGCILTGIGHTIRQNKICIRWEGEGGNEVRMERSNRVVSAM